MRPPAGVGTADPFAPNAYYLSNRFLSFPAWVVLTPKQFIILAAAGPAVNLVLAEGALPGCWAIPPVTACVISSRPIWLLGAFNLLPIYGLDGWQINSNLGILFHFKIQTQKHSCVN